MLNFHLTVNIFPMFDKIIIYISSILKIKGKRLTSSGGHDILNGHFGWLYEEELTGYDGYRWSPDSKTIAFWEEDQSKVDEYILVDHLKKYPKVIR